MNYGEMYSLQTFFISYNRDEFIQHGFGDIVTVENKNVLLNGFGLNHIADAGTIYYCQ